MSATHQQRSQNLELFPRHQYDEDGPIDVSDDLDTSNATDNVAHLLRPITKQKQNWVLLSAFPTIVITIGFNQAYGVFQRAYVSGTSGMLPPSQASNTALVSLIGALGSGLTWTGSIFIKPLMERVKSIRYITVSGVLLMSLGFGLASMATQLLHLILTQGLLYGIDSSLLYFPILSTAPEYFDRHRAEDGGRRTGIFGARDTHSIA